MPGSDETIDERFVRQHHVRFHPLLGFLTRVPAIRTDDTPFAGFATGEEDDGAWWVRLSIDLGHRLAWSTVQELAFVLNGASQAEQLPTLFKPISPPPYLNGGPDEFLSWVIECPTAGFAPATAAKWLEARMPNPIEALDQWPINQ